MKLQGRRVTIRNMRREDVAAMSAWRPFADPLYQPFDFPRRSTAENLRWFNWRMNDPSRRQYTIEDEARKVIGSLTLREIDGKRSARMGITLGADFVSHGYGTEAMAVFLDFFFFSLGFAKMVLDVAATNLRAVRAYRALGFRRIGQHYRPAGHPSYRILREEARYGHLGRYFRRQGTAYQVLFYDMAMTDREWQTLRRESDAQPTALVAAGNARGPSEAEPGRRR